MAIVKIFYQGRVQQVFFYNGKKKQWDPVDLSIQNPLWEHHCLFQDAVNYYLLALAAMTYTENTVVGKMRQRLNDVWDDFSKNGELCPGMHHSVERTLGFPDGALKGTDGLKLALKKVLDGNDVSVKILELAVSLIMEKCKGDKSIKYAGRDYLPRLTDPSSASSWDFDASAIARRIGKQKIFSLLFEQDGTPKGIPEEELVTFSHNFNLSDFDIKVRNGEFWNNAESKKMLKDAANFYLDNKNLLKSRSLFNLFENDLTIRKKLRDIVSSPVIPANLCFEKNKPGTDTAKRNVAVLFLGSPCRETLLILQYFFGKSEIKNTLKIQENTRSPYEKFDDDPVKLSRGNRGYVFKAFTRLPLFAENIKWRDFDIAAFKEALKTLNQFGQKGKEREEKLQKITAFLAWMDGVSNKRPVGEKDSDDDDENLTLPILQGDPRWDALRKIQHDLGVVNDFTDGEIVEYGLAPRTIRGFSDIREKWDAALQKGIQNQLSEQQIQDKLVDILNQYQTEHRDSMGSVDLFRTLTLPEHWMIWRSDYVSKQPDAANNMLEAAVQYFDFKRDAEDLKEPIHFSPADEHFSRRLGFLQELKKFSHENGCSLTARIAVHSPVGWTPQEVKIIYSAPRLLRDGLKDITESETSHYLPLMNSCLTNEKNEQNFSKASVQLMPDLDRHGRPRVLLNFSLDLDMSVFHQSCCDRFVKQFLTDKDGNPSSLEWPEHHGKNTVTWTQNGEPFDVLSIDLGQRTAGAASILHVSPDEQDAKYSRFIGNDGIRNWYALRKHAALLRLPGEDCLVMDNGKLQEESFGSKGRKARTEETKQFIDILADCSESELFSEDILSFPEQNDKLLVAVRRFIGRFRKLNRWLYIASLPGGNVKVTEEMEKADFLPEHCDICSLPEMESAIREKLIPTLLTLTNRILPLRGRKWCVKPQSGGTILLQQGPLEKTDAWIRGQRGLSFARLIQLEELRKLWQSANRMLMRQPGEKTLTPREMRDNPIPDPCPDILVKMDAMKKQRVNQTAHMILALALGVRLKPHAISEKERDERNIHGEYEKIPGRSPVSFIIMERLSPYHTSQDRAPSENARLMKWMHRSVTKKIRKLCKPFGLEVMEVEASYSSRFSSISCVPGFRANEVTLKDKNAYPWKKLLQEKTDEHPSPDAENCRKIFSILETAAAQYPGRKADFSVPVPQSGGEIFIPANWLNEPLIQADINASVNIGLRGIASPLNYEVFTKIRAEKADDGTWMAKGTSKRDIARFGKGKHILPDENVKAEVKLSKRKRKSAEVSNFFVDLAHVGSFDTARFESCEDYTGQLTSGKALWKAVHDCQWDVCLRIAEERLKKLKS